MGFPIRKGAFDALVKKDAGVMYLIPDAQKIAVGDVVIANFGGNEGGAAVKDVSFDTETQTFTFTYSDETTKTVDLVLESVLQSVDYDAETHTLTLTLVSGETSVIALADVVGAYTAESTDTVDMAINSGVITADVSVSAEAGNQLSVKPDGLFVPEPDADFATNGALDSLRTDLDAVSVRVESIANLGNYAGTFDTFEVVPASVSGFANGITVNDFVNIRADESKGGDITRHIAAAIDENGSITWQYDISFSTDISGKADINSPAFTGAPTAPSGTDYGVVRLRNIMLSSTVPESGVGQNGDICLVYA